jgi:O-antigen/teichoic acid export membrane protein
MTDQFARIGTSPTVKSEQAAAEQPNERSRDSRPPHSENERTNSHDSLANKAGVVVFAQVVKTLVDIVPAIVLVRMLSSADFVIISFLLLVYETAKYLATLGFPDSVFYFYERVSPRARTGFALQTCGIMLVTGTVAAAVILAITPFLPHLLPEWSASSVHKTQRLLPVMAFVALTEIPTWPVNNIMLAADNQRAASSYNLLNSALLFACILGPIALGYPIDVSIWCLSAYSTLRLLVSALWLWRILPTYERAPGWPLLKQQIRFSIPIGLSMLVSRLNRNADKFIVSYFLAEDIVALYMVGATEIPLVRVIPFAVGSVLISRFVQFQMDDKHAELRDLWYAGIQKVSLVVLPLAFLFITLAPEIISVLFGAQKVQAALPFQIYSLIILLRVTSYGSILQAFGDTAAVLKLALNLLFWNVALSIPFTLWFGIVGTATAAVVANYINLAVTLRIIGKHMREPWYRVLPLTAYLRILVVSVGVAGLTWVLRALLPPLRPQLSLLITMPFFAAAFLAIGSLTNVISAADRRQLTEWLKLRFLFA